MNDRDPISAILIAGPTASGKSAIALHLAEALDGIVINADAMQVYRDLRIVTARPTPSQEARAPHRLYGVLDAEESCSAGRWLDLVRPVLSNTLLDDKLPIIVGGTGLYLKALTEGIAPIPPIPDSIREQAQTLYDKLGGEAFRRQLKEMDPEGAAKLPPTDRQRLIRAFEVAKATGMPLGKWHKLPARPVITGKTLRFILNPERTALYARCDERFDRMVMAGAVDEVKALVSRGLSHDLPVMKALGVQELAAYLAGEVSLERATSQVKTATRRYAKRQIAWLKTQMIAWTSIKEQYMEKIKGEIFMKIFESGLTLK